MLSKRYESTEVDRRTWTYNCMLLFGYDRWTLGSFNLAEAFEAVIDTSKIYQTIYLNSKFNFI